MPDPEKVAEIVQHNLTDIGITVNIVREEWAPYLEKTSAGEHELFLLGWSGSNGDPDYFFSSLLHGDAIGGENRTYLQDEKVNDLFHQAQVSVDQDERVDLYKEAQEIILEEAPMVNLVHSTPLVASSSSVKGFIPHPSTSDPMEEVYLEEQEIYG